MIINKSGIAIRTEVSQFRQMNRATQGVRLITLKGKDAIAAVAKVPGDDQDVEDAAETAEIPEGTAQVEGGTGVAQDDSEE